MHILILQHARVETAGSLGQFLKEDGHTSEAVSYTHLTLPTILRV